jgi:CRP-like cAMP-binding protein
MYKQLFDHIKKTSPEYTEEDLNNLLRYFNIKKVSKGDTIVKAGSICRNGNFVVEGCFRYFTINSDGVEFNTQFAFEDYWMGDMPGILNNIPSKINIQALEDSTLLTISATDYNHLLKTCHSFALYKFRLRTNSYHARTIFESLIKIPQYNSTSFTVSYRLLSGYNTRIAQSIKKKISEIVHFLIIGQFFGK